MKGLKECPFCGCDNVKMFYDERQNYHVECYGCGKTVSFHIAKQSSTERAIEIYNRRAEHSSEGETRCLTRQNVKIEPLVQGSAGQDFQGIKKVPDSMLNIMLNGPTVMGIKKGEFRGLARQLYAELQTHESRCYAQKSEGEN